MSHGLSSNALGHHADVSRRKVSHLISEAHRSLYGQFLTPASVAKLMASMLQSQRRNIVALDPGAGTGSLTLAMAEHFAGLAHPPHSLHAVCYECEEKFVPFLEENLERCAKHCAETGLVFSFEIRQQSFLEGAAEALECCVLGLSPAEQFDVVILNPPYKKISTTSQARMLLRAIGLETVNLYTGFLGASAALLRDGGELVAITPRSFCNGPYYRPFRQFFLGRMSLRRFHLFDSRDLAFKDDGVLQETIITYAAKSEKRGMVCISSSEAPEAPLRSKQSLPYEMVVKPDDEELFIRILTGPEEQVISERMASFCHSLSALRLEVSTGRVVDFRSREHLAELPGEGTAPLIYPLHFSGWTVSWPDAGGKKPNAIRMCPATNSMLLPPERFVLTKRFSAKEERRRIVAVVYEGDEVSALPVAFENHLNYFHSGNRGLDRDLAWGLAAYLNSGLVDSYFRTFNGHTQVNATDLRTMQYPSARQLRRLGSYAYEFRPTATQLDDFLLNKLGDQ